MLLLNNQSLFFFVFGNTQRVIWMVMKMKMVIVKERLMAMKNVILMVIKMVLRMVIKMV